MIKYEDNCVSCGLPCLLNCPYRKQLVCICDECKDYITDFYYEIDNKQFCQKHAIDYIEENIEYFEKEYGIFESEEDITDLLETNYKRRF